MSSVLRQEWAAIPARATTDQQASLAGLKLAKANELIPAEWSWRRRCWLVA
jgi:hypothetical protein